MLLLKTLHLLSTNSASLKTISSISNRANNPEEFDRLVKEEINPSDYNWEMKGVGRSLPELMTEFIQNYMKSQIDVIVSGKLNLKSGDVANNATSFDKLLTMLESSISSVNIDYGRSLEEVVKQETYKVVNNSLRRIKQLFEVKKSNGIEPQEALIENSALKLNEVTDPYLALSKISAEEVSLVLSDIHSTRSIFTVAPHNSERIVYSMYESFLRSHFERKFKRESGVVEIELESHTNNKLKKLDEIISSVYDQFLIQGITNNNLEDFSQIVYKIVDDKATTNTGRVFGIEQVKSKNSSGGNFNTGYTFTKEGKDKFDTFIRGCIALSKLYQMLRDCNIEPYAIHPSIFSSEFEDPGVKFNGLDEVVRYSAMVVNVRKKYGYNQSYKAFKALRSPNQSTNQKVKLSKLLESRSLCDSSAAELVVRRITSTEGYFMQYLQRSGATVSLFDIIKCLDSHQNPLQVVYYNKNPHIRVKPDIDLDEVFDIDESRLPFYSRLTKNPEKYLSNDMSPELLNELIKDAYDELGTMLDDLVNGEANKFIKVFRATKNFGDKYINVRRDFTRKFYESEVTSIEDSHFIYNTDMFKGLRDVIKLSDLDSSNKFEDVELKIMTYMLNSIDSEINRDLVDELRKTDFKSITIRNFSIALFEQTFCKLAKVYLRSLSNMANLTNNSRTFAVTGEALLDQLSQLTFNNHPRFQETVKELRKDSDGYFVNENGSYYDVINSNNMTGVLHSIGWYIFKDAKPIKWGGTK